MALASTRCLVFRKLAHFDREVIPGVTCTPKRLECLHGTFTVTHDITKYTKAKLFSEVGKKTDLFARFDRSWRAWRG
ncbi:catalase [Vibrio chagasii]|nr:catalase [Vibrio chagasii]